MGRSGQASSYFNKGVNKMADWNGMSYEQAYKAAEANRAAGKFNGYSPDDIDVMYGKKPAPRQLTVEEKYANIDAFRKSELDKLNSGYYDNADNRRQWLGPGEQKLYEQGKLGDYFSQSAKGPSPYDDWNAYFSKQDAQTGLNNSPTTSGGGGGFASGYNYGTNWGERAKSQAAAEAAAKTDALNLLLKQTRNAEMSAVNNMDRDYFQKYLQTAQGQTNNGLNAGLAAEQNTRLAMARQTDLADVYQDINAQNFETNNNLARVPVEQLARENELLTQLEQMGWERDFAQKQLSQANDQFLAELGFKKDQFSWEQAKDTRDFDYNKYLDSRNFDYSKSVDQRNFDYQKTRDARQDAQWESEQKYSRWWEQFQYNNMSAAEREASSQAWAQLQEQKRQFNSEEEWRKYTYDNMSAAEKAQLEANAAQFGEEMAWNLTSLEMAQKHDLKIAEAQYGAAAGGSGLDFLP
jgi:hypothetical protein